MRVIYGLYEAWLTPSFFVEKGQAYDPSEPDVAAARSKCPSAFGDHYEGEDDANDEFSDKAIEQARRGPGRPRNV